MKIKPNKVGPNSEEEESLHKVPCTIARRSSQAQVLLYDIRYSIHFTHICNVNILGMLKVNKNRLSVSVSDPSGLFLIMFRTFFLSSEYGQTSTS